MSYHSPEFVIASLIGDTAVRQRVPRMANLTMLPPPAGGTLYKTGQRKDCDILFYRIRQLTCIDMTGMWAALAKVDFEKISGFGWCYKAVYKGKSVDCFFPEGERDENGNEIEYGAVEVVAPTECPTGWVDLFPVEDFSSLLRTPDGEVIF